MARTMYDSVTASDIPQDADMVAGYVDGPYAWSPDDWGSFDHATVVHISINPHHDAGDVLDVEQGDARPSQAPNWVQKRRRAHVDPVVYCSANLWPAVRDVFDKTDVSPPHWWVADWTGHPHVPAGAVACQYASAEQVGHHYDLSRVTSGWPDHGNPPRHHRTPRPDRDAQYTVQIGDTLSGIGAEFGVPWRAIWRANRHQIGPNPDLIYPGQTLVIPNTRGRYTVRRGDTLSGIAARYGIDWHELYAANRETIGPDPDLIYPGEVLTIP